MKGPILSTLHRWYLLSFHHTIQVLLKSWVIYLRVLTNAVWAATYKRCGSFHIMYMKMSMVHTVLYTQEFGFVAAGSFPSNLYIILHITSDSTWQRCKVLQENHEYKHHKLSNKYKYTVTCKLSLYITCTYSVQMKLCILFIHLSQQILGDILLISLNLLYNKFLFYV